MKFGRTIVISAIAVLQAIVPAASQQFPVRPMKIVVPFPPGGSVDAVTRIVANSMRDHFNSDVTVENRPGAGTIIGAQAVARSAPDGYTLLMSGAATTSVAPLLTKDTTFNPKDLSVVSVIMVGPYVLLASNDFPGKTMKELIAYAKANPRKINWATQGVGSSQHLVSEKFARAAGIEVTMVPHQGTAQITTELIAGRVDVTVDSAATALPNVRAGKFKAIGISSNQRSLSAPELPTFREGGLDMVQYFWFGIFAPASTPRPIMEKLHQGVKAATASKAFKEWVAAAEGELRDLTLAESQELVDADMKAIRELISSMGLQPN